MCLNPPFDIFLIDMPNLMCLASPVWTASFVHEYTLLKTSCHFTETSSFSLSLKERDYCCDKPWEQYETLQLRAVVPEAGHTSANEILFATALPSFMPWAWILAGCLKPIALG